MILYEFVIPASTNNLSLAPALNDGEVPIPTLPILSSIKRWVLFVRKRKLTLSVVPINFEPEFVPLLPAVSQLLTVVPKVCHEGLAAVPTFTSKALMVVLKMISPVAGKGMAFI